MKWRYFDAHTHVNLEAFREDDGAVMARAAAIGVGMINIGTAQSTSQKAVTLAEKYVGAYAAVGLHPAHTLPAHHDEAEMGEARETAETGEDFDFAFYAQLAREEKVVAIGECGLDYYRIDGINNKRLTIESIKQKQEEVFLEQIRLAYEIKKPLMIHCRAAFSDLIEILENQKEKLLVEPGVIHFFAGTLAEADALARLGFAFTFGGVITFARDYDEVIRFLPPERVLAETDAPYVTPVPHRGKRNEPAYVVEVYKKLAELRGLGEAELRKKIRENVERIFGIK